jgi:hypothetical protein
MTKKEIKQLVFASYTKNNLDMKKINKIIKLFTKKDFKSYIKFLKAFEKTKNLIVEIPSIAGKEEILKYVKKLYPEKNIVLKENKKLLAGIKIIDNDIVYEENLKNKLENIVSFINY